ncbi:MAG: sporulation initiation factor Spo0A C-terminal domain-containing protein [Firmicutes bacterium]|nr:sporulation initiation factor Spo0A C-terminal domain-containing protein [Bacillota bacterium]
MCLTQDITNFLLETECPVTKGYDYLKKCIEITCNDVRAIACIGKDLYQRVGDEFGESTYNVEKCIRKTIERWWPKLQNQGLFSGPRRPTNKQCIIRLAALFKRNQIIQQSDIHITVYEKLFG